MMDFEKPSDIIKYYQTYQQIKNQYIYHLAF